MPNFLNIGTRALQANQSALQVTGNNIANVNTTGYSRQRVILNDVQGQFSGSGYYGNGVEVNDVQRIYSEFLTRQSALASAVTSSDSARLQKLTQLEDIFQGGSNGLGASLSDMLNAFSDVANAPTDLTARAVVLTKAEETAARFRNIDTRMSDIEQGTVQEIKQTINTINNLAKRIADTNQQIVQEKSSGHEPNELLDKRDQLINELNTYVQTSSIKADDGSVSVFVAGSQAIVLGKSAYAIDYSLNQYNDSGQSQAQIQRGGLTIPLSESALGGGKLSGLLHFQNADLAEARNLLGRMALAVTSEVNTQHRLGLDLNNQPGGDFFTPLVIPPALGAKTNASQATVLGVTLSNPTLLAASQYEVRFSGPGAGTVTRLSDGQVTTFPQPSAPVIQIDGLSLQISGVAASAGDQFLVKPFAAAPPLMQVAFSSPRSLAVANQVEVIAANNNSGGLSVDKLVAKKTDPNLTQTVTFTFNGGGTFNVTGTGAGIPAANLPFTSGQPLAFNGWELTLKGTPRAGDTFTVKLATPGNVARNAGNAGAILDLRDVATFDGAALTDGFAGVLAKIGNRVESGKFATSVSSAIASNTEKDRAALSGVNLDEEAAKLLQYQQAYQASAKLIQVSQALWDTLTQSVLR